MKSFDSRTYSINDFIEWDRQKQLELNPIFQRRSVWSDKAKSYLMDTIIRGKPIPKIFIRQKINVSTKTSIREVVDGQQRLRTILSYVKDGFTIYNKQNKEYGGKYFSELPEEIQSQILSYEIAVDLLINLPDAEVLDIFNRLNSYAVVLNDQERINASHFGEFKILVDGIAHKYYDYWISQKILTPQQVLRMGEVTLVADLLISIIDGIRSKKQIKKYYDRYEREFDQDADLIERRFDANISIMRRLFSEGLAGTQFRRIHIFYTLFNAIDHAQYGVERLVAPRPRLVSEPELQSARHKLDRIEEIFTEPDVGALTPSERQFLQDSRRATTDEAVRERRAKFLLGLMG